MTPDEPFLQMHGIRKEFPGAVALDGVTLDVRAGEAHALVGENGAGKSTLIKILAGIYPSGSFEGRVLIDGRDQRFHSVQDGERAGIGVIHQELALVKHVSAAENIFLGHEKARCGLVDRNGMLRDAGRLLEQVGLKIDPRTEVARLGVGEQQLVEIAKALRKKSRVLVLDEPTAALAGHEVEILFAIMRSLLQQGVSLVYISHKLDEVFQIADRVTVLRDGRSVLTDDAANLTRESVVRAMVGREVSEMYPPRTRAAGKTLLEVENLSVPDPSASDRMLLQDVSFRLSEGEILGIAGLMGAGRTLLLSTLFGCGPARWSGRVRVEGREVRICSPADAIRTGLALAPEDRKQHGLVLCATVEDNLAMTHLSEFCVGGIVDGQRKAIRCRALASELGVRASSLEALVETLSGGNQQKVVLGKWLLKRPKVLLLDEPTRGIDVGAKAEIHRLVSILVEQGMGALIVSSELPELLGVSDRVLVLREGRVTGEFSREDATPEAIMRLAT